MDILNKLREELQVERWQVEAAVKLIDEGNTIPLFPDTVRKRPVPLNDEVLRNLYERLNYRAIWRRKRPPLWRASKSRAS